MRDNAHQRYYGALTNPHKPESRFLKDQAIFIFVDELIK